MQPKHFNRLERTVQSIAPFFEKFELSPNRLNPNQIQLEWKEVGASDSYFNASLYRKGFKNVMTAQKIITNRKLHKKGGNVNYEYLKNDVE
ncbi:hypothetical protein AAKU52_001437 [Pedobacter sp. CG_S7]|uniref:hypothetical protein n=1 Tax=Pedobacter sp. CG_S7 TaxID=3143930 RepID=UPI0033979E28